ncbi:CmcJ/NvfI family oxidoreductase [Microbacterium kribbense]|uniref:CmcJ/NvfI family oxidoreductase n=1 Tax=Microbacterium kribbense TaxID=433645 RepID=A0ABP7GP99_9MICO
MRTDRPTTVPALPGVINYLSDDVVGDVRRESDTSGEGGSYAAYALQMYDARAVHRPFSVEQNGFELVHWPSAVRDFADPDEIDRVYTREVEEFVAARLGAAHVALLGACLEDAAEMEKGGAHDLPVAHVELTAEDALEQARRVFAVRFPSEAGFRRAVTTVCWRPITPAPQDWPLALCDYRSVPDADGVPGRAGKTVWVDPGDVDAASARDTRFRFRSTHRWWVYPDMTPDEVLFFVVHDSDHSRPWRVMRTTFLDAQAQPAVSRQSLEFRSIAYFR